MSLQSVGKICLLQLAPKDDGMIAYRLSSRKLSVTFFDNFLFIALLRNGYNIIYTYITSYTHKKQKYETYKAFWRPYNKCCDKCDLIVL